MAEIGQWISLMRDIFVGGSAAAAAIFAYLGLNAWRRELKGRSEYQLAKNVLKALYKVREAFKIVRHPVTFSYEYPEEMRTQHGHLKPEFDFEGTSYVYQERWTHMTEAFRELEELHLQAQVEWGAKYQDVIKSLRGCRVDLQIAIEAMLDHKKNIWTGSLTDTESEEVSIL